MKENTEIQKHSGLKALIGTTIAGIGILAAYKYVIQPWHLNWGASAEDVERKMFGDSLVDEPDYVSTRAVLIEARPEEVYPWLIQIGQGRGGMYSYDWIENLLGLDIHSVEEIIPELQDLKVGDTIPLEPSGAGLEVKNLEANKAMTLAHPDGGWTWDFKLYPVNEYETRLVSRNRFSFKEADLGLRFYLTLIEPGVFIMERKMLLGIKERVARKEPETQKMMEAAANLQSESQSA